MTRRLLFVAEAVESAFGGQIDYAMLVKLYGNTDDPKLPERRYSPAMAAGVTDRMFDVADLVNLLIESERGKAA